MSACIGSASKAARSAYQHAAIVCATEPADMLLVAVHPWDIDGAARAGLHTAWINRGDARYPATVAALTELAAHI